MSCLYVIFPCPPFSCWIKAGYILSSILWIDKIGHRVSGLVFFYFPSTHTLCTCGLCYRSIHLFGNSVFCAAGALWNTVGRRGLTGQGLWADISQNGRSRRVPGVLPAISTHTKASSRRAIPAQVCRGRQTFRREVVECQGHILKPIKLVTTAGFPLFPSKVRAAETQPTGTEPQGAAAAKSKDLGHVLSSVTGSLWQEHTSASQSWDTSFAVCHRRSVARRLLSQHKLPGWKGDMHSCITLKGLLESKVSKNSHRDQTQIFKDILLIIFERRN